jgi:hypothetical protein
MFNVQLYNNCRAACSVFALFSKRFLGVSVRPFCSYRSKCGTGRSRLREFALSAGPDPFILHCVSRSAALFITVSVDSAICFYVFDKCGINLYSFTNWNRLRSFPIFRWDWATINSCNSRALSGRGLHIWAQFFLKKKDSDELVFFNRTIILLFRLLLRWWRCW